ncbi:uncharacterized protein TRIADDRAFT_23790, partial [Trichoplax adhaerens]
GTSRIKCIQFGSHEIETWHVSPYPEDITELNKIFICEFCLRYMKSATTLQYHMGKCNVYHPPGIEIYRKDNLSVFEVDGNKQKEYCRNLCLLAKLFLDHKTLFHDVEPFLFYVMAHYDTFGYHMIGYFSKEKRSECNYNLSCIMILPQYMKQGYGKMLIDFSYLLSRLKDRCGSPERPLSDLGLLSYRSYWKSIILQHLQRYNKEEISLKEISQDTAVHTSDLISTLQSLDMLKYWKGMHLIHIKEDLMKEFSKKNRCRPGIAIDPTALKWSTTNSRE